MCMHWLKYVRFNRKDRLKNMHNTTLNVCLGPSDMSIRHSLWINLTLIGQQNVNRPTSSAALEY